MWALTKKCGAVALREIFILILCVATLSFLLTYQLGQSVVYVDTTNKEYVSHGLASLENIKIFGRSLNMHASSNEKMEPRPNSLLSRLLQLEERLLQHTRRRKIGVVGLQEATAGDDLMNLQKSANRFSQDVEENLLENGKIVIQGNYSMIVCAGEPNSCPEAVHSSTGERQRTNRIVAIERELCGARRLCEVSNFIQGHKDNRERKADQPCHTISNNRAGLIDNMNTTFPVIVATHKNHVTTVLYNTTVASLLSREQSTDISSIWTFPTHLLAFQSGPLLRLQLLVASFRPLRLYVYPTAATGPVEALSEPSLFKEKTTYEEILQYVGEQYGLAASNQWWNTIQILLMKTLVSVELSSKDHYTPSKKCVRCFGAYTADVLCVNIRTCYIMQMKPLLSDMVNFPHDLLEPLLHLMTSERMVAMDVATALEEKRKLADFKLCDNDKPADCLTDDILIYFLVDRREALINTDLIKIYPTVSSAIYTPFLSDIKTLPFSYENGYTTDMHYLLMSLEAFYSKIETALPDNFDVSDDIDMYGTKLNPNYVEPPPYDSAGKNQDNCTEDSRHYKDLANLETEPALNLQQYSRNEFHAVVDYDVILIKVWASARHCCCEVRFGDVFEHSRPTNFTLGLGENTIKLLLVDIRYPEPRTVHTLTLHVFRESRGQSEDATNIGNLNACSIKQDCSLPFSHSAPCGLQDTHITWSLFQHQQKPMCTNGDVEGGWTMPCTDCKHANSCYWKHASWQPDTCIYRQLSVEQIQQCLVDKKLLFLGDSTNRGIMHYIVEQINGSLHSMDKTHSTKMYPNLNSGSTNTSFAYYPHFWLPAKHRPKFSKVLYQLIKRSFPLENNANTVLVVGGVHWIAKRHVDVILAALKRTGLSNITKIVKGVGAGFHQNIQGVRFVNKAGQANLLTRERDVLHYAKQSDFKVVGTFNMTMARYKDFTQGKCACHFHKISKQKDTQEQLYRVEGDINAAYSQILLHNICNLS